MRERVCVKKVNLFILILVIFSIGIYTYNTIKANIKIIKKENDNDTQNINNEVNFEEPVEVEKEVIVINNEPETDPIREYDYRKVYDPLESPTRRVPRHVIPPVHIKQFIDIPTRGYPDNFKQIGLLIKQGDVSSGDNEKILRLFGRQEFPGSNKYEYYTSVSSGNEVIKVPIEIKGNKELYDDDIITVDILGSGYKVDLHDYDSPKYYPNIF